MTLRLTCKIGFVIWILKAGEKMHMKYCTFSGSVSLDFIISFIVLYNSPIWDCIKTRLNRENKHDESRNEYHRVFAHLL